MIMSKKNKPKKISKDSLVIIIYVIASFFSILSAIFLTWFIGLFTTMNEFQSGVVLILMTIIMLSFLNLILNLKKLVEDEFKK